MSEQECDDIHAFVLRWRLQGYVVSLGVGDYVGEVWVTDFELDHAWNIWMLFEYVDGVFDDQGGFNHYYWWGRWPNRWQYH